jgi:ABC-2 type transport system permease protein
VIEQVSSVKQVTVADNDDLIKQMKDSSVSVGLVIPQGFENQILNNQKAEIKTFSLINNFSVLAGKKFAVLSASTQAVNEAISTVLANRTGDPLTIQNIKNPIAVKSFIASKDKILQGDPSQLLSYILSQTTSVPVVLFVVIIMAAQMIAAAVATEKENKTLETLLSLPISRKTIVVAKMLSAGLVSLLMAGIYMLGINKFNTGISGMMNTPSTQGVESAGGLAQELGLKLSATGLAELGVVLFLAILLALAIAMVLGAFSEDAKSAQGVVTPLMILIMIPYFITLFLDVNVLSAPIRYAIYAIPFSHIFLAIPNVLLGNHLFVLYGALYLLVLFIVFVFIAARIFSSDLILTMKLNFSKKKV